MLVQAVHSDLMVPDIRYNVPCGVATVIPGNLACDSRDLSRMISEGRIRNLRIPLDNNPRLNTKVLHQPKPLAPEIPVSLPLETAEVLELRSQLQVSQDSLKVANSENQRLNTALGESRVECGQLLAECSKLRAELAKLEGEDSKLSLILGKLDRMPSRVVVQGEGTKESKSDPSTDESDVPYFVPTFPEPVVRNMGKPRTNVVENKGETPGDALRKFRKSKGS